MDFWGQVWKRVWKVTFFGLKLGQDLENRAAHPNQEFPGIPPRGGGGAASYFLLRSQEDKRRLFSQDAKELT